MTDDGVLYLGERYASLSEVARTITGTRWNGPRFFGLRGRRECSCDGDQAGGVRCAVYIRKSSDEGLEQLFNSLHAQREACEAYVKSQVGEGWMALPEA